MHVVFRESHGLEETDTPTDLGQDTAELVVLSFSDSDLGAFAAGWHRAAGNLPTLRLANLVALRHPLSVDTYVERTLAGARGILIRLIGGGGDPVTHLENRIGEPAANPYLYFASQIVAGIGPKLAERGMLFVGLDVIGGCVTEINVTSPTGVREIDKQFGTDLAGLLIDAIDRRLAARARA